MSETVDYTMTNDELSAAIQQTHEMIKRTGTTGPDYQMKISHIEALLLIREKRAEQVIVTIGNVSQVEDK